MIRSPESPLWIVGAGLALAAIGLAVEPRQGQQPAQVPEPTAAAPSFATADSNGSMIAVTGVDITGASILYLVDTERRNLAVYQATGGSSSTSSIRLIGARNIDLDLQLDGLNDQSDYSYKELQALFERNRGEPK